MYDKQAVRRRRAVLGLLVGLSIVLLTGYFGEGQGGFFHGIQHGFQTIFSPIQEGASRAFKPVRDLVGGTGDLFHAKSQNKKLKAELTSTRNQLAQLETAARDNQQLAALDRIRTRSGFPAVQAVTGRVIAKDPTVWYSAVTIDRGRGDGIRVDQPVITGDGLIGKVTQVTPATSTVTLITDASSAVSAEVVPDGASGIVKPAIGNPNDMRLEFIEKGRKVKQGDVVVTSGFTSGRLTSLFPRGIPIGKVTRVETDELELYQLVHIQPFADFRRIDYVQVITSKPDPSQPAIGPGSGAGGP